MVLFPVSILKDPKNFFMQYLPCLYFMSLNDNIVDTEKPDGICSPTFVADNFSGLLLHPSMFSIEYSRSA